MVGNDTPKSLSLTALTSYINEKTGKVIHRDTLLHFLKVEKGYIEDIRTVSELGLKNGVSYQTDTKYYSGKKWPVYDHTIQRMIIDNIDHIDSLDDDIITRLDAEKAAKDAEKKAKREAERKAKHAHISVPVATIPSNGVTTMNFKDKNMRFPYLHLDDFVLIDTESTGLTKNDEVVELSVVDIHGNILYESTFRPTVEINPMASKVNGFTNKSLMDAPLFKDEWSKIEAAIDNRPVMCHNTPFDKRIIKQTCERYGISADIDFLFRDSYDSKEIAKDWMNAPDYSLETLAHLVGINEKESHRASDDCKMMLSFIERLELAIKLKNEILK